MRNTVCFGMLISQTHVAMEPERRQAHFICKKASKAGGNIFRELQIFCKIGQMCGSIYNCKLPEKKEKI